MTGLTYCIALYISINTNNGNTTMALILILFFGWAVLTLLKSKVDLFSYNSALEEYITSKKPQTAADVDRLTMEFQRLRNSMY